MMVDMTLVPSQRRTVGTSYCVVAFFDGGTSCYCLHWGNNETELVAAVGLAGLR